MKRLAPILGLLALAYSLADAAAIESVREQEIRECRSGEVTTWGDGQDRPVVSATLSFTYNPVDAPSGFPAAQVAGMVTRAAEAWAQCGVPIQILAWPAAAKQDVVVVQWSEKDSNGNFGQVHLGRRKLSLGPSAFELLRTRNPRHDAGETLQLVISHEMGHFFGLMAHSRRCVDVLSYYHNEKGEQCYSRDPSQLRSVPEYRHILPTACDIVRCRAANGKPPL